MTPKWSEYQFPKDAFQGHYKLRFNKDLTINCEFIPNEYCTFEIQPWKYHFLGTKVSKLDLINLIIELWPYRPEIENFDLKIMPWLKFLHKKIINLHGQMNIWKFKMSY
jgi:hypothetical protein